ncbi:MAG: copper amine oxidase N-terminal domain-containing protein, partial [Candidatus Xenobia bacterium]
MRKAGLWVTLLALVALMAAPAVAQNIQVTVNGQPVALSPPAAMIGGRVLVPVRGVFQQLGASVVWDAASRSIRAQNGNTTILLTLGSNMASINGQNTPLDQPPTVIGGSTMVPLRFVSQALGAQVQWVASQNL